MSANRQQRREIKRKIVDLELKSQHVKECYLSWLNSAPPNSIRRPISSWPRPDNCVDEVRLIVAMGSQLLIATAALRMPEEFVRTINVLTSVPLQEDELAGIKAARFIYPALRSIASRPLQRRRANSSTSRGWLN
jgi:hypothetical protein